MDILVDDREDKERIKLLKNNFSTPIEVIRLEYGDIIIKDNNNVIAIETKTIQDFIGSCRNGQIKKEALNMKKMSPFSFIIIYDDGKWNKKYTRPLTNNEWYGNIVSLMQRYKVPVIICEDSTHFIKAIKAVIRTVGKNDEPITPPIVRPKNSNEMINVLIGIPKVGAKMARVLLDTFKTPGGVFNATDEQLNSIPRLQTKSKEAIRRMR